MASTVKASISFKPISSTILFVPVTFPPDHGANILSGMGVPDILGTNGTFSFYTTESGTLNYYNIPSKTKEKVAGMENFIILNNIRLT